MIGGGAGIWGEGRGTELPGWGEGAFSFGSLRSHSPHLENEEMLSLLVQPSQDGNEIQEKKIICGCSCLVLPQRDEGENNGNSYRKEYSGGLVR